MEETLPKPAQPLFEHIDCVSMYVSDLDEGLKFYCEQLGLNLLWRGEKACGLAMQNGVAEFVLTTDNNLMVDMKVADVEQAVEQFVAAGGKVEEGPFEIDIGKCAVVSDPWGNQYCILDTTKGTYDTDGNGKVSGVSQKKLNG